MSLLKDLNARSQEILKHIVDAYCETGAPIGSRTLSERLKMALSPATIRGVMADLEKMGLLHSLHTSSGRVPTDAAFQLFVHAFLEVGNLSPQEKNQLDSMAQESGLSMESVLEGITTKLSGLTHCAGLVMAPKTEAPLKHVDFVGLSPGRALLILISEDGTVENRILSIPLGIPSSSLMEASNYLTAKVRGKTLGEARLTLVQQIKMDRTTLQTLTGQLVEEGVALWTGESSLKKPSIILKGHAHLLDALANDTHLEDLRLLFETLEQKEILMSLLDAAIEAEGVQIFLGTEHPLFEKTGCTMVISPYKTAQGKVLGAIGVIGPTRINYGRIIPMVDYTAKMVSKLISKEHMHT